MCSAFGIGRSRGYSGDASAFGYSYPSYGYYQAPYANYSAYSYPAGYSNPYSSGYPYPGSYGAASGAAQPSYSSYPYGGNSTWLYGVTGYWQNPWHGYSGGNYYGPFSTTPY